MSIQLTVMSLDFDSSAAPITKVYNKDEITLGRLPGNDLVLDKPEVSGYHARLRISNGGKEPTLFVKDLGSSNGTMVENNSLRAQVEVEVQPNQRIIIGNYLIKPSVAADESAVSSTRNVLVTASSAVLKPEPELEVEEPEAVRERGERELDPDTPYADTEATLAMRAVSGAPAEEAEVQAEEGEESGIPAYMQERGAETAVTIEVAGSDVELSFAAVELFAIEGTVLHNGSPLEGVEITAERVGSCRSDESGRFAFNDVEEGTEFSLEAKKNGFEFDFDRSPRTVEGRTEVKIAAVELFDVCGRVEHHGRPLSGVTVNGGPLGTRQTDDRGVFCFEAVRDGTEVELQLEKEEYLLTDENFSGTVGSDLREFVTSARKLFRITGVITHKGKPLAGVTVDGGQELGICRTDDEGRYVFENVPEDAKYTLTAKKDDFTFKAAAG